MATGRGKPEQAKSMELDLFGEHEGLAQEPVRALATPHRQDLKRNMMK